MKALVGAACVAIIAFVVYFFWGEYQRSDAAKRQRQANVEVVCDGWVAELNSWKNGTPQHRAKSFAAARDQVDSCFNTLRDTQWYSRNIAIKYW